MSWNFRLTKGMPEWVFGIAWLNNTLYIGLWIFVALHFRRKND